MARPGLGEPMSKGSVAATDVAATPLQTGGLGDKLGRVTRWLKCHNLRE